MSAEISPDESVRNLHDLGEVACLGSTRAPRRRPDLSRCAGSVESVGRFRDRSDCSTDLPSMKTTRFEPSIHQGLLLERRFNAKIVKECVKSATGAGLASVVITDHEIVDGLPGDLGKVGRYAG